MTISNQINHSYRVVTLDGQVVNPGGSLTGGAAKKANQSILSQQAELDNLNQVVADMNQKLASKELTLSELKAQVDRTALIVSTSQDKQRDASQQVEMQSRIIEQKQTIFEQLDRQLKTLKLGYQNTMADNETSSESDLRSKLNAIQGTLQATDKKINQLLKQQADTQSLEASQQSQQHELHEQLVLLQQEQHQVSKEVNATQDRLDSNDQVITEATQQRQQLTAKLSDQPTKQALEKRIADNMLIEQRTKQELADVKQQMTNLNQEVNSLNDSLATQNINLNNVDNEAKTLNEQVKLDKQKVANNQAKLLDNYELDEAAIADFDISKINIAELISRINMLQRGIEEIGPVNVTSIQEFADVTTRYEFLDAQRKDLVAAEHKLQKTMSSMDQTISTKFSAAFKDISKSFAKVFVEMFGGGEAKLVLTDPDDLLNTGMDIMVQPPGKTYRDLNLLSGGEKALTAITLLFALIKVRPVPFCILDEAEAALDPFNADRFAQYLKQYGADTQFIVITHRKETMIYADQLYGITMQESGVSKVISVNLDNTQEEVK